MLVVADYVVFGFSVIASMAIGMYFAWRGKNKWSTEEYFLGGRNMNFLPVGLSLLVSFESSILVLGFPAEVYTYGASIMITTIGQFAAILVVNIIATSVFYRLKLTSVYQYVPKRFGENSKLLTYFLVGMGVLYNLLYIAIVLIGLSFAIEALTGIPVWCSILGISVVGVTYTSIGGMRAVIWTDVFQFVIMLVGMITVIIQVAIRVGGVGKVISINKEYGRLDVLNFNPNPTIRHTVWTLVIGGFVRTLNYGFSQQSVQRINSTPTESSARKVMYVFAPGYVTLNIIAATCGLFVFAYYVDKGCDPLESKEITNPNQIIVHLISELFQTVPGLSGLFLAALTSACLSTISSCLNGMAAIICEELLKTKLKDSSNSKSTKFARICVIVFGIVSTILTFAMMFVKGTLSQIFATVIGSFGGPITGVFLVSMFMKRASVKSVLIGGIAGLALSMWLTIGYNFSPTLPKTPWLRPGPTYNCTRMPSDSIVSNTSVDHKYDLPNNNENLELVSATVTPAFNESIQNDNDWYPLTKPEAKGLDKLYSVSYQYFSVICTSFTVVVSVVVTCFITRNKTAGKINPMTILDMKTACCTSCSGGDHENETVGSVTDIEQEESFIKT